mgnify:CR=1 FL=1
MNNTDSMHLYPFRELYIDATAGDWWVRVGKQQVVWGKTDFFRLQDLVNPVDFGQHFFFDSFEDIRIPQWILSIQRKFGELVKRRQGWARALLRRMCSNAAEADDLAQEAFIKAWERIRDLETPAAFPGWPGCCSCSARTGAASCRRSRRVTGSWRSPSLAC